MNEINSVLGSIKVSELGKTLIHEHMRIRSEEVYANFPHLYDEKNEFNQAVEQINKVKRNGVQTIFDPTVMGLGRDIQFIQKIACKTGIQIIAATGIYTYHYLPPHFQNQSVDYMANLFVRDIEKGIQNTSIKAGFLKCATDKEGMTPDVQKVIRAVARAHKITNVPIMTHSYPKTETGLQQLEILVEEGVDPNRVMIGHTGDTDDIDRIKKILDYGAYIGMDRYGITRVISTEKRNETILKLAKMGYSDKMFLSQDYCCTIDWYDQETLRKMSPDWSMTFLFDKVIPELKSQGLTDDQIDNMMLHNVKKWCIGK